MESLLSELRSDIPPIPNDVIFAFLYDDLGDLVRELESNSECRPTSTGPITQTRLTTDMPELIEVRLEVEDTWKSLDGATVLPFQLTGTCRYHLRDGRLADLKADAVRLVETQADGSQRVIRGSRFFVSAGFHGGTPPIHAERGTLE